tara:strand:- start:1911 stop:2096 length:186 start_codon:yes stop_codon:yes gene_type:complete
VPIEDAFFRRVRELKEQHIEHLAQGSLSSHEEYRHICGVIKGLSMAEVELKELISAVGEDL